MWRRYTAPPPLHHRASPPAHLATASHLVHRVAIAQSVRSAPAAQPCRVGTACATCPLVAADMRIAIRVDLAVLRTAHACLRLGGTTLLALGEVTDVDPLPLMPAEAIARAVGASTTRS